MRGNDTSPLPDQREILRSFIDTKITFSQEGLHVFFKRTFNRDLYGNSLLPLTFIHVIDFLEYGRTIKNPRSFAVSVLDIFLTRFKRAQWANAYAILQLLENLPRLLGPLCGEPVDSLDYLKHQKAVKEYLYAALLTGFGELKKNPDAFLDKVSYDITALIAEPKLDDEASIHELHHVTVRFLESILDKLIFDLREQEYVWKTVKLIAEHLELLLGAHILPDVKTLNQLYWSLLERFCYALETMGSLVSHDTYQAIKNDLAQPSIPLLLLEEQEDFLTPKLTRLKKAITDGEIKARAREHGILTR